MGARDLLHDLEDAGLSIRVEGERLIVTPRDRLTDDLREAIKAAKPDLLALLMPSTEAAEQKTSHAPQEGTDNTDERGGSVGFGSAPWKGMQRNFC